jgi:hypothetical protein
MQDRLYNHKDVKMMVLYTPAYKLTFTFLTNLRESSNVSGSDLDVTTPKKTVALDSARNASSALAIANPLPLRCTTTTTKYQLA